MGALSGLSGKSGLSGIGSAAAVVLLASYDITEGANIDSFTRPGAAGYTTTGDASEFQRESAADTLRIHKGNVLLEDDPTPCALVAPGAPDVTPGVLEFDADFDAIPITASLLRYEYRIDAGSWTSNGTSTTLTDIAATAGAHTLSVRAVSTSGVAGSIATSAEFTVDAGGGGGATLKDAEDTSASDFQASFEAYIATPFIAGSSYSLSRIDLMIARNASASLDFSLEIRDNSSGSPGNTILGASDIVPIASIPAGSFDWVQFDFSTPVAINSGTTYWIVLTRSGDDLQLYWEYDATAAVEGIKEGEPGAWSTISASVVGMFRTYGT